MRVHPQPSAHPPEPPPTAGRSIAFRVLSFHGDKARILIGSRPFFARFNAGTATSGRFVAQILSGTGNRTDPFVLSPVRATNPGSSPSPSAAEAASGRPLPDGSDVLVRAFLRSGLPIDPARLAVARRVALRPGNVESSRVARVVALLEEKGLLDSSLVADRVVRLFTPEDSGEKSDTGRQNDQKTLDGSDEPGDSGAAELVREDVEHSFQGTQQAGDPLQLFNHRRGRGSHWILVPIESAALPGLDAVLAVDLAGDQAFGTAYLHVGFGNWTSIFRLKESSTGPVVSVLSHDGIGTGDPSQELAEILSRVGATLDGDASSHGPHDGFSDGNDPAIIRPVDRSV